MYFTKTLFKVLVYVIGRNVFKKHLGLDEPFPTQEHIPVTEWHIPELPLKKGDGIMQTLLLPKLGAQFGRGYELLRAIIYIFFPICSLHSFPMRQVVGL